MYGRQVLEQARRHPWALGIAAALLIVYSLAGFLLVPHLARAAVTAYVEQKLGRQVRIGALHFNPYTFELDIDELALSEADGAPLLGFRRLCVNADPLVSLFTASIAFKEVRLLGPDVSVIVGPDGSVNLARLAPPAAEDEAPPSEPATVPAIRIGLLALEDGRLAFEDRRRAQPFSAELKPVRFALANFRTKAGYQNQYQFTAASEAGEQFAWSGRFAVQPLSSEGRFSIKGLLARTIDAYLRDQLPLQLASGVIDLDGRYRFALQPRLELGVELPRFSLHDFAAAPRGGGESPLAIRALDVQNAAFSLTDRRVHVQDVSIEGTQLTARREADRSINLMKLLPSGSAPASPSAGAPSSAAANAGAPAEPWRIAVDHLRLRAAAVQVEDRTVKPAATFRVAPIDVALDGYRSEPGTSLQAALDLAINDQGRLHAEGTATLQPLGAQLAVQLQGLDLSAGQPYLAQLGKARLHSGVLGFRSTLSFAQARPGTLTLRARGDVTLDDLRASGGGESGGGRSDFARWKQLAVRGIDFSLEPARLDIDSVTLKQPFGRIVINPDQTLNVAQILKPPSGRAAPAARGPAKPAGPSAAAMPVRIGRVLVENGSAFFADRSIEPSFSAGIVQLHGSVRGISSDPSSRATIRLDGQLDRHSPVEIRGSSALLDPTRFSDVRLAFRNIELTTFNPYSGKYAGYDIAKGKLTTELSYHLDRRRLEAEHHVVLDQLEFGEATHSKDAAPLPVRLAVALLKDRRGIIDLELPVRGSLDDPEFKYGRLVWKVLGNLVTKIVTAPFAALGALSGGGEELSYLDFPAGSAALTPEASGKLGTLGKALAERPQLKLEVPAVFADADREALARAALAAKLPAGPADDKARLQALEKLQRQLLAQPVKYPDGVEDAAARIAYLEPLLLQKLAPDDEALQRLGGARARAVQDALLAEPALAADRIFLTTGAPPEADQGGGVRMALKLQ